MADGNRSIFETIDELKKNTVLIKKIGEIAKKGSSEKGDAKKANAEIIELLRNSGISSDNESSSGT